jgi:hypothetical protein
MSSLAQTTFIPQSILRLVQSLFRSEFSTQCDLVLPLSIFCILSFPQGHAVAAYLFFLVFTSLLPSSFPSITSFRRQFPQANPLAAYFFFFVFPSLLPSIFPSITCFRRQFLRTILKLYNVGQFEMVVNNCVGQRNVRSILKFTGTVVRKTRKLFQDSLWTEQESKQ